MEGTADCGAMSEALVFLEHFRDLPDPRQRGKVIYPLNEVLLLWRSTRRDSKAASSLGRHD